MADWTRVLSLKELPRGGMATVREGSHQILLIRESGGTVRAIDNRCPHEGYPLRQGYVKDGALTCAWHNWKFRLRDGACVMGGEDVRAYEVRLNDDDVYLNLSEPPPETQLPKLEAGLDRAFNEQDFGHAARDVERMLVLGRTPAQVLGFACDWAARHALYGFDHGQAAAADYAALFDHFGDAAREPLMEAVHTLVQPHARREEQQFADAQPPDEAPDWALLGERLVQLVEDERQADAQSLFRGALEAGAGPEVVFDWLTRLATDHFLSYGHEQIYTIKAEELLQLIGWEHAHPVLTSLISGIVTATREDTLPYMRAFNTAMEPSLERLDEWHENATSRDAWDARWLVDAALDGELRDALHAVEAALEERIAPDRVALALAAAASERVARFDPGIQADETVSEGWLHVTHMLTHADAVRESLLRHPSPKALRGLFHSARFTQHTQPLDLAAEDRDELSPVGAGTDADAETLLRAIQVADPAAGVEAARRMAGGRTSELVSALKTSCVNGRLALPIFVAHHIKTVMAAIRVADALRDDPLITTGLPSELPLTATVRFLCHPLKERRLVQGARVARDFVRAGKMRGNLLGY